MGTIVLYLTSLFCFLHTNICLNLKNLGFRSNEKFEKDCFVLSLEFILRIIAFIFFFIANETIKKKFRKVKTAQYPSLDTSTCVKDAKHFPSLSDILELGVNIPGINHKLGYNILFRDQGISWYPGILIFRGVVSGNLVSWYPGILIFRGVVSGNLVSWFPGILIFRGMVSGNRVSWYPGILIFRGMVSGNLVSWYPGILVVNVILLEVRPPNCITPGTTSPLSNSTRTQPT